MTIKVTRSLMSQFPLVSCASEERAFLLFVANCDSDARLKITVRQLAKDCLWSYGKLQAWMNKMMEANVLARDGDSFYVHPDLTNIKHREPKEKLFMKDLVVTKESPDDEKLAKGIHIMLMQKYPYHKTLQNASQEWVDDCRKLLYNDKHPYDEAVALFRKVHADAFWSKNILSTSKFREQYDNLKVKLLDTATPAAPAYQPAQKLEID